jgi:hypothetical protein
MKKQCINTAAIVGLVFLIGVLLGNIIVPYVQEKEISIEPMTQTQSIVCLEKPTAIKHFTDEGATTSSGGRFLNPVEDKIVTRPQMHNSSGPVNVPTTKEEVSIEETTKEESTTEEVSTSEDEISSEEISTDSEETTTEEETTVLKPIINADSYRCSLDDIYYTSPIREYTSEQKELIAKMLYCEAGGEGWDCQVATCSAIINFIEHYGGNFSVLDNGNKFSPASYYRYKTPTKMNWEVLDYVLSGYLIANVKYFQLYRYHSFGTPMFKVGGVYFSK